MKKEQKLPTLKVKTEEPSSPKIQVKIEELPTPILLYPTEHSQHSSLDPNSFDWGEKAMVD